MRGILFLGLSKVNPSIFGPFGRILRAKEPINNVPALIDGQVYPQVS